MWTVGIGIIWIRTSGDISGIVYASKYVLPMKNCVVLKPDRDNVQV